MVRRPLWKRVIRYVQYDLREIIAPRSMPDPPDYVPPRKLTWKEEWRAAVQATKLYRDTWKTPVQEAKPEGDGPEPTEKEPSLMEEFSAAARGGVETLRPFAQKLYASRTAAYRDAVRSFLEGYREGVSAGPVLNDWDPNPSPHPPKEGHEANAEGAQSPSGPPSQEGNAGTAEGGQSPGAPLSQEGDAGKAERGQSPSAPSPQEGNAPEAHSVVKRSKAEGVQEGHASAQPLDHKSQDAGQSADESNVTNTTNNDTPDAHKSANR